MRRRKRFPDFQRVPGDWLSRHSVPRGFVHVNAHGDPFFQGSHWLVRLSRFDAFVDHLEFLAANGSN